MTDPVLKLQTDAHPHAGAIASELSWLGEVIEARLKNFFEGEVAPFILSPLPKHDEASALQIAITRYHLDTDARLILALAIAPHVNSAVLDHFHVKNSAIDRPFSQFGGVTTTAGAFQPTAETALFLIAGASTQARIEAMRYFEPDHPLRHGIGVALARGEAQRSTYGAVLDLHMHRVVALCDGTPPRPDFSPDFPAKRLTTKLDWDDLVLPRDIRHQLGHVTAWLKNRDQILGDWGLGRQFGRGFKALFYGPPGTGKTLTATLLGKRTDLDVYRIDLSMVVSKYIGETEKNLGLIFDMAAEREWILFFDEADALFGERTATSSSNDRYANQEVSYLLQRIEECESLVILATNLRSNIDDAFFRRFQISVGFTRPDKALREVLWRNVLSTVPTAPDVDLKAIAADHDLTGGSIANAARHAAITALRREAKFISAGDLDDAITTELRKEGRTT